MVCEFCGREMVSANGCVSIPIIRFEPDGKKMVRKTYRRQKVGDEGRIEEGERCWDCGALFGHYHHFGCDIEKCPICGNQLAFCGHAEMLVEYSKTRRYYCSEEDADRMPD